VLRARLATAAVAIPLLLVLILAAPAWAFALVVGALAVVGVLEFMSMAFPDQRRDRVVGMSLGVLVAVAAIAGSVPALHAAIAGTLAVGLLSAFVQRPDFETGFKNLGVIVVGVLYAGFLLPHFVWLRENVAHGAEVVVFLLATAMAGDSGGYFIGRSLGRHKLMPRVSPGKSVEGAAGIVVFSVVGAVVTKAILVPVFGWAGGVSLEVPLSWAETLWLSLMAGVVGQLGDLSESVMKRTFGSKESGWVFPGHGGVLDRIDSLLFPLVFVYYYLVMGR
jgi:phosphatidate cytidylyltransferase